MTEVVIVNHTCDCGLMTQTRSLMWGLLQWYCEGCGALIRITFTRESGTIEP